MYIQLFLMKSQKTIDKSIPKWYTLNIPNRDVWKDKGGCVFMAVEIKRINTSRDQANSVVEVYQWFGWQLKNSQFLYEAEFIFERDKNMPHYAELVALEDEFFCLISEYSQEPPYMPPHVKTIEEWARHFQPDLRTYEEQKRMHIGYGIAMGVCLAGGVVLLNALDGFLNPDISNLLVWGVVGGSALIGVLWYHAPERKRMGILKKALHSEQSEYRKRLQLKYNATVEEIQNYEKCKQRIAEIREISYSLLND